MLIPNHNVPFSIPWHLSLHLLDRVFSQSRNYDILVLSDLAKGGLEIGECNYQKKTKCNVTKSMCLLFFHAVYHSKKSVIPHSAIAAILDFILNISKRKKQQYTSQILQIQSLLKTIGK